MKPEEIRNMSEAEIEQKVFALRKDLFELNHSNQSGRVDQPHKISVIKKDIARCLTVLREKTGRVANHL